MDVTGFWRAVLDQDAAAIRAYFAPDAQVRWPCTNERFSVEEFLRANCAYPGDWDGAVERTERLGELWITVTRVWSRDRALCFHVTSFLRTAGGKIAELEEFWAEDGDAPQWRRDMGIGSAIS